MSSYWTDKTIGVSFKARSETNEPQYFQRNVWTQINFRDEKFDTAGQYFPSVSTFQPTVPGKYNIRAQVHINDIIADGPSGSEKHRITVAIYKNTDVGTESIAENSTIISNYYPDDSREDATAVVETLYGLLQTDIDSNYNKFTAWVKVENIREDLLDDPAFNPYTGPSGCTAVNTYGCAGPTAQNYIPSVTVDDGSCYYNKGCADPTYFDYWIKTSTSGATDGVTPIAYGELHTRVIDHPDISSCTGTIAILGCTDYGLDPENYNIDANVDDGSCNQAPEGGGAGASISGMISNMVYVPAGDFIYGPSNAEETRSIATFFIDTYEVTAGEYKECVEAGECSYNGPEDDLDSWENPTHITYNNNKDNHPINFVNWQEADDYCKWKGKRLPTDLEWEKAARGTDGRTYPWGEEDPTCDYAVMNYTPDPRDFPDPAFHGCGTDSTWEVGQKPNGISPYGAYDMQGNVKEWTATWNPDPDRPNQIFTRSASWDQGWFYEGWSLFTTYRKDGLSPTTIAYTIGFRCVLGPGSGDSS